MSKNIEEYVAGNEQANGRINSTFIELNSRRRRNLSFSQNELRFVVTLTAESRDLNDTLISGHPNEKHGSGRGRGGDYRGPWTDESLGNVRGEFTVSGRKIVSEALNGEQGKEVSSGGVGEDESVVSPADTQLGDETDRSVGWAEAGDERNQTDFTSQFLFPAVITPTEFGAFNQDGEMYARVSFESFESPSEEELRFTAEFEVSGSTPGNAVFTDDGLEVVAESIRSRSTPIGLQDFVFGSGTSDPDPSDSSVDTPEFEVIAGREIESQQINLRTLLPESSPDSQPHEINQIGVVTNSDVLVWLTSVDTVEKDDSISVTAVANYAVR